MEEKVALEVAEQEFNRWAEAMDLDIDPAGMDAEDMAGFNQAKRRIIKAIRKGALVFNDEYEAVYTPQRPGSKHQEPLVFHERTGASLMATNGKKDTHAVSKMYAILGDMCRVPPSTFAGLSGEDAKVSEALFLLLMA